MGWRWCAHRDITAKVSANIGKGSVWSRLGSDVTVVEFLGQIGGPGMDADVSKQTQKILTKQGMKFKLNTKVTSGDAGGEGVKLEVESSKGGKAETVGIFLLPHLLLNGMRIWMLKYLPMLD